jgi:hypothetical protein
MSQFQTTLPTVLHQQSAARAPGTPVKVFAPDASRRSVLPIVRKRMTAWGVPPIATITHTFDAFYLYGAVEPTTGDSFCRELPGCNASLFHLWGEHFAQALAQSCNLLGLDKSACHTAKTIQWPANVPPGFLPPYSPELNPMERRWRDLKDKVAARVVQTLDELSDTLCQLIQGYSQAALHALTGFTYFVQAVETAWK